MEPKTVGRDGILADAAAQTPYSMSGLVAGTLVMTADGEMPIEFLAPGDRIISRVRGIVTLKAVDARTETIPVVSIAPGVLGQGLPKHATMMAASQRVLLRGAKAKTVSENSQAVIDVGSLVDGETVTDLGERELRLIRLVFDKPEVIYAEGIEVAINTPVVELQNAA